MGTEGQPKHSTVAALRERIADVRHAVDALHAEPGAAARRARLLRRVSALRAEAKRLGVKTVAQRVADACAVLEAAPNDACGRSVEDDLKTAEELLAELPELADVPPEAIAPADASGIQPAAACVVGEASLETILQRQGDAGLLFVASRIEDPRKARAALGPFTPELFVIDADVPGAFTLVSDLIDDPKTELVPVVVVGKFRGHTATEYKELGAVTFEKPVHAAEVRARCVDAVEQRRGRTMRMSAPALRAFKPPILAGRPVPSASTFDGRRVLVASDDSDSTWFIAEPLRAAGCDVEETLGATALLERAFDRSLAGVLDLVFCDLRMRGGGGPLCRALRGDVGLRDVPIVLVARPDDPPGLSCDADVPATMLPKGATQKDIVAKATELLVSRSRLAERLRSGKALSGRIEAVSVARLVSMALEAPRPTRVRLTDGAFVHELHVELGKLRRVTRMSPDGRVEMGPRAMATALGVTHGSYAVDDARISIGATLAEDLFGDAISATRALCRALGAARLPNVVELRFDPDATHWIAGAVNAAGGAPKADDRTLLQQILAGVSPRLLVRRGDCTAERLELVLLEMCRHGFITSVREELGDAAPETSPLVLTRARASQVFVEPPLLAEPLPAPEPLPPSLDLPVLISTPSNLALTPAPPTSALADDPSNLGLPVAPHVAPPSSLALPIAPAVPPPAPFRAPPTARIPIILEPPDFPVTNLRLPEIPQPRAAADQGTARSDADVPAIAASAAPPPLLTRSRRVQRAAIAAGVALVLGVAARWAVSGVRNHEGGAVPAGQPLAAASAGIPAQGLLDVVAPEGAKVLVDNTERGRGPRLSVSLPVGSHQVKVSGDDKSNERVRIVEIARGKVTHIDLTLRASAQR